MTLEDCKLLKVEQSENNYVFQVKTISCSTVCPSCNNSQHVRKFGTLPVICTDLPRQNKKVHIRIERRRFQCKACSKTFFEDLPHIDEKRRCTKRLKDWLINEAFNQSFVALADQTGLTESTIRRIFEEYAKSKGVDLSARKAVKVLGKFS